VASVYERVVGKKNGCVYGQEFDNDQMVLVAVLVCVKVIEKNGRKPRKYVKSGRENGEYVIMRPRPRPCS